MVDADPAAAAVPLPVVELFVVVEFNLRLPPVLFVVLELPVLPSSLEPPVLPSLVHVGGLFNSV